MKKRVVFALNDIIRQCILPSWFYTSWGWFGFMLFACEPATKSGHAREELQCNCWLDEVTDQDTVRVIFSTVGCFHHFNESIYIYRQSDRLMAAFNTCFADSNGFVGPYISPLPMEAKLVFSEFIAKGAALSPQNSCTTIESYHLSFRNDSLVFVDSDCLLGEYQKLKRLIFTESQMEEVFLKMRALKRQKYESRGTLHETAKITVL